MILGYRVATIPPTALALLFVAVFALLSPLHVIVRLLVALAIVATATGIAGLVLAARRRGIMGRPTAPTAAEARAEAHRRAAVAGRAPRPSDSGRVSAV